MKNLPTFLFGMAAGCIVTWLFFGVIPFIGAGAEETSKPTEAELEEMKITYFEQPINDIETPSFKVKKVLVSGHAIANSQDLNLGFYSSPTVLLLADEDSHYYTDQIVRVPRGKRALRVGSFEYEPYYGQRDILPVVRIPSSK